MENFKIIIFILVVLISLSALTDKVERDMDIDELKLNQLLPNEDK